MYQYYFIFRSVTSAQHSLFVLRDYGIAAVLVPAPAAQSFGGCGFALRIKAADAYSAAAKLRQSMLVFQRVLRSVDGARFEEVAL